MITLWKVFARDSPLWQVFFYGGMVVIALSLAPEAVIKQFPAWLEKTMPTVRLLAFVATVLGGKLGLSPAPMTRNLENK